jgi:glycosyltransferase involved in cell wall biosynthesis
MLREWNCPAEKIVLIPHGTKLIDVPDKFETRRELNIPENAKVILSWGFLWESKGIGDLIEILSETLKTFPETILIHAGGLHPLSSNNPEYLKSLLKSAIRLGITPKNFKITQWVPEENVPKWFSIADVIVLNYMRGSASASGAAHRALASQRPLVGTDDQCLEDIPKFTVPRFAVDTLQKGILEVLQNKFLQEDLVRKQNVVAEETSWKNVALKHKEIYCSV